jgi:hypothetical protein
VTGFVTEGSRRNSAFLFVPSEHPDRKLVSVSYEEDIPNLPPVYATASFSPNAANGCSGMYEAVIYWPVSCDAVAARQFARLKTSGKLGDNFRILELPGSARVFLMPADKGCVSIKKEILQ